MDCVLNICWLASRTRALLFSTAVCEFVLVYFRKLNKRKQRDDDNLHHDCRMLTSNAASH